MSSARDIAARVLGRVWEDRAFAAAALDAELARVADRDPRDAALATELVYGVLRTQGFLEAAVAEAASRGRGFDEPIAKAHLLMGFYTLAFLDQIPVFAAVTEAVDGVKAAIGPKPAGFTNALLRAYARKLEQGKRPDLAEAAAAGAPGWLRGALRRTLGRGPAAAFLASGEAPPVAIAVADPKARDAWITRLSEALGEERAAPRASVLSEHGVVAKSLGDARKLDGFERDFIVQEEGAQVIALACGARPGERVLDACGGRGNKSWLLSHRLGADGAVLAADKHPHKLAQLLARSHGPAPIRTAAVDWTVGAGELAGDTVDRALVDAPCSGIGTLRRRPEIALFRDPASLVELARDQVAITRGAARLVRDGGALIYAVCSVLREECEDVLAALAEPVDGVRLEPAPFPEAPGVAAPLRGRESARLLPAEHGTDGYFVASLIVRR